MLLGTLEAISMANILADKRVITKRQGKYVGVYWAGNGTARTGNEVIRADNGIMKVGQNFWFRLFLWIILKYKSITKMNLSLKVFMHKIISQKDGAYEVNLDEYKSIGTHWIRLYVNDKKATYFDRFGAEHLPKEIKKFIDNKNITASI